MKIIRGFKTELDLNNKQPRFLLRKNRACLRHAGAARFFPSSKRCSVCHHHKDTLRLSEVVFVCEACGAVMDRDLNAACNLQQLVLGSA